VRSAFLQNREYMDVFYREGYTVMEMEAGPYLSAAYEIAERAATPRTRIVSLVDQMSFELGVIHYASDTPYSRRQSLLSKSLSYFGMERHLRARRRRSPSASSRRDRETAVTGDGTADVVETIDTV